MHKNTFWLIFAVLCTYFALVFCEEFNSKDSNILLRSDSRALEIASRTRKKHHLHHLYSLWGIYGLAIAFFVKIKAVVVAFFVGSALYMGFRYMWPHKCAGGEIYREGSVVLDHPPSFVQHEHIPYSLDHYHEHPYDSGPTAYEPYSAYSSHSSPEYQEPLSSSSYTEPYGPSGSSFSDKPATYRRKRSEPKESHQDSKEVTGPLENLARQMVINEERIGEFMFLFLGLDTDACRRRFICEMEFKSKTNPLTSMAFRVVGQSFFAKYINKRNPLRKANFFDECAKVNAECVFIENNEDMDHESEQEVNNRSSEEQMEPNENVSDATTEVNSLESNDIVEKETDTSGKRDAKRDFYKKRLRGDRHLMLL